MEKIILFLMIILGSIGHSATCFAADELPLVPSIILQYAKENGPEKTLFRLWNEGWHNLDDYATYTSNFEVMIEKIGKGDEKWLEVADALLPGAGAGTAGWLIIAMTEALAENPEEIVKRLKNDQWPVALICDAPMMEMSGGETRARLKSALMAIEQVNESSIFREATLCRKSIEWSMNDYEEDSKPNGLDTEWLAPKQKESASKEILPLKVSAILDYEKQHGPKATLDRLWNEGWDNDSDIPLSNFEEMVDLIATGDDGWLEVADRLLPGAGAAEVGWLTIAVAQALPENPEAVLTLLKNKKWAVEFICDAPAFKMSNNETNLNLRLAMKALDGIKKPDLENEVAICRKTLEWSKSDYPDPKPKEIYDWTPPMQK